MHIQITSNPDAKEKNLTAERNRGGEELSTVALHCHAALSEYQKAQLKVANISLD